MEEALPGICDTQAHEKDEDTVVSATAVLVFRFYFVMSPTSWTARKVAFLKNAAEDGAEDGVQRLSQTRPKQEGTCSRTRHAR